MNKALSEFDAEWTASNATKDRTRAVQMAKDYFAATPVLAGRYATYDLPALVDLVSKQRQAGNEAGRIEVDMFIAAFHAPQQITGVMRMGAV